MDQKVNRDFTFMLGDSFFGITVVVSGRKNEFKSE